MKRLGRYEVRGEQSRTALSCVYRGYDTMMNRAVSIVVLNPVLADDPERVEQFERQALLSGHLKHRNVVTVFDYGQADGQTFIVLEYLDGAYLDTLIRSSAVIEPGQKVDIFVQAATALDYLGGRGIIHDNVRASSIHVMADGTVKLAGLDYVRRFDHQSRRAGSMPGLVHYLSPEEILGRPTDSHSDQFLLGATMYELFVGRLPFVGTSIPEVVASILSDERPPLHELQGTPLAWLEELVLRCLRRQPDERWPSCHELAEALRERAPASKPVQVARLDVGASGIWEVVAAEELAAVGYAEVQKDVARLLALGQDQLDKGLEEDAMETLRAARKLDPFNRQVRGALESAYAAWRGRWLRNFLAEAEQALLEDDHTRAIERVQGALMLDAESQRAREILSAIALKMRTRGAPS